MIKYIADVTRHGTVGIVKAEVRETEKMYIVESYKTLYGTNYNIFNGSHLRKANTYAFDDIHEAVRALIGKINMRSERLKRNLDDLRQEKDFLANLIYSSDIEAELTDLTKKELMEMLK